jgi:uncharacterized membrane protein YphA (DoxX/SURF4 family)
MNPIPILALLPLGATLFGAVFLAFWVIIAILAVVFWLWMLIDCLMRDKFQDKLVWILVLVFLHIIGAIIYYFLVKGKDKKKK